jgi:hypothetical protein
MDVIYAAGRRPEFHTVCVMLVAALFAGSMPLKVLAQDAIKLNMSDVYFQWRPMPKGSAMCGYSILGNHLSRDDPKVEWDMNIDEIVQGDTRVAAVSAGTFVVNGKTRTPRLPITELTFTMEDDPEPVSAQLIGTPNRDNGVRGTLDLARATKLFSALSNDQHMTATLKYADGTSDLLKFAGFRDTRKLGKNGPFEECLRGFTPRVSKYSTHPVP